MIKIRRAAAVVAASLALAVGALAVPASAATSNAPSGTGITAHEGTVAHNNSTTFTVAAAGAPTRPNFSACSIEAYGQYGQYICGTRPLTVSVGSASLTFVIGTNWAIWETSSDGDPWWSLGGQALHTTNNGISVWSYSPYLVIWTWGTDGQQWCDKAYDTWSGWYRCTG